MFCYKNISRSVKTFYGVSFAPGEIKEVPGRINSKHFITAKLPVIHKPTSKHKAAKAATTSSKEAIDDTQISENTLEGGTVNGTDCDQ